MLKRMMAILEKVKNRATCTLWKDTDDCRETDTIKKWMKMKGICIHNDFF